MFIEVDAGLPEHPKSNKLCAALRNPMAWGYAIKLWRWCCLYAKDGDLSRFGDEEVEYGLGWSGEPGVLMGALRSSGFVERTADGRSLIHDWMKGQGKALAKMEADAQRQRERRLRPSNGQPPDGPGTVAVTARVPNQTNLTKPTSIAASASPPLELLSTEPPQQVATRQAVLEAIAAGSKGRFKATKPTKGGMFRLDAFRQQPGALDTARRVGEWLGAGGDAWKASVDGRSIGTDLEAWAAQAMAWDGKSVTQRAPQRAEQQPTRAPVAEWKPKPVKVATDDERKAAIAAATAEIEAERAAREAS